MNSHVCLALKGLNYTYSIVNTGFGVLADLLNNWTTVRVVFSYGVLNRPAESEPGVRRLSDHPWRAGRACSAGQPGASLWPSTSAAPRVNSSSPRPGSSSRSTPIRRSSPCTSSWANPARGWPPRPGTPHGLRASPQVPALPLHGVAVTLRPTPVLLRAGEAHIFKS